ncbi:hypothetical protein TrVE_jg12927 [Triparma verrucosa]|uniref:Ribosomal RNA large subunit methyltransferase K/L-like methyltransferase domain-containing protein n=1 Tax=Triparma verrucosa TaxID=1606542 RepID=A0A9W7BX25_9STRA|nr:hypothetical protein TrVE_jg12927 [Triparma verrucosa]
MRRLLHLSTLPIASLVLLRLSTYRSVYSTQQLTSLVRSSKSEWKTFLNLTNTSNIKVRTTATKSKLNHTQAIADAFKKGLNISYDSSSPPSSPSLLFHIRNDHNKITLSVSTSSSPLYSRPFRTVSVDSGKSPLRGNIASYMCLKTLNKDVKFLVDPFCGSGGVCIEAGVMLRKEVRVKRDLEMKGWRGYDYGVEGSVCELLKGENLEDIKIVGFDRDRGVVEAAKRNAERAGVADLVEFREGVISDLRNEWGEKGVIVSNPPWGKRLDGGGKDLRNLYGRTGEVLRKEFKGWGIGMLTERRLWAQMKVKETSEEERFSYAGVKPSFIRGII